MRLALAALVLLSIHSSAQQTPGSAPARDEWSFEVIPYLWAASLDGSVEIGSLPAADVDASFADLLENLDFAASVFFSARRGDLALLADVSYTELDVEERVAGSTVTIESTLAWASLAAAKRIRTGGPTQLEAFAGARWFAVDNDAESTGVISGSRTRNESWIDPLVGLHVVHPLGTSVSVDLVADVGGFGVGSDLTYEILPSVAWHLGEALDLRAGYRWLDVDYEDSDFVYDVRQTGFVVGLGFGF